MRRQRKQNFKIDLNKNVPIKQVYVNSLLDQDLSKTNNALSPHQNSFIMKYQLIADKDEINTC